MAETDKIVIDPFEDSNGRDACETAINRTPTKPMPFLRRGRIEVDLEDPEAVASFLEFVAKVVREKRRLVLHIE